MAGADLDIEEDTAHIPSSRGFTLVAGQQLVGMILGFVVWALLARMLPVEDFGEFNAAFGVATMAGTLANLGIAQYVTVPFRAAIDSRRFELARGLRRVVPWCIIVAALFAYAVILSAHLMFDHGSFVRDESFAAVLALLPLIAIMLYLVAAANAHGAPGPAMFLSMPFLQIMIGIGLGSTYLVNGDAFDILDAALIWVIATTIACAMLWRLNLAVEAADFKTGPRTLAWRTWMTGAFPFFLNGTANVFLIQAPFLVLGWTHTSDRGAAMFAAADRLAQLLAVAGLAGGAMFLPPAGRRDPYSQTRLLPTPDSPVVRARRIPQRRRPRIAGRLRPAPARHLRRGLRGCLSAPPRDRDIDRLLHDRERLPEHRPVRRRQPLRGPVLACVVALRRLRDGPARLRVGGHGRRDRPGHRVRRDVPDLHVQGPQSHRRDRFDRLSCDGHPLPPPRERRRGRKVGR